MSHRGETLHKDVCCIADLKEAGGKNLGKTYRGGLCPQYPCIRTPRLTQVDYYDGGAMDLITYDPHSLYTVNKLTESKSQRQRKSLRSLQNQPTNLGQCPERRYKYRVPWQQGVTALQFRSGCLPQARASRWRTGDFSGCGEI
jgi:hypothetical protein